MSIIAISRAALCVAFLLAIASCSSTEAAKIETFNGPDCIGAPTNTFYVGVNTCLRFYSQGSVRVSEVTANTRVSVHNQQNCEPRSSVAQFYGPYCVTLNGAIGKIQAVGIQGG